MSNLYARSSFIKLRYAKILFLVDDRVLIIEESIEFLNNGNDRD